KELIPDFPALYAKASIERLVEKSEGRIIIFLENVGFPSEYTILAQLGIPIVKVYMTDKSAPDQYKFMQRFRNDSRYCLRTPESIVDPTPEDLVAHIKAHFELTA